MPFGGSAERTHDALPGSELCVIAGGPHGCNISHPDEFNEALVGFLASADLPRPAGDQQLTLRRFRCARRRGSHDGRPITALEGNFGA
jgi:hypothetical protein